MNQIRAIQALNKKEIENGISPDASWHVDYRDTAFVYFGGLPYEVSEGDVITIFSQFGEPVWLKLARDKETGKSKGFGWLKYENQRSTDLAVDNLGGATIGSRMIRVDHARYKFHDDEDPDEGKVDWETMAKLERGGAESTEDESDEEEQRPVLPEERELAKLIQEHDEDDPMKAFLVDEKKKEVQEAVRRYEKAEKKKKHKHRHRHHRSHRLNRDGSDDEMREPGREDKHRHRGSRRPKREESPRGREKDREAGRERRRRDSKDRDGSTQGEDRERRHPRDRENRDKEDRGDRRRGHRRHDREEKDRDDLDESRHRSRRIAGNDDQDRERIQRRRSRSRSPGRSRR